MYKVSSDKKQAALHHGRLSDWVNGEERLSEDDRRKQLQQSVKMLEDRIKATSPGSPERKRLGLEKLAVQDQLKELRDARPKAPVDWKAHFINEAHRILSSSQFEMVMNAAKIEAAREEGTRTLKAMDKCPPA